MQQTCPLRPLEVGSSSLRELRTYRRSRSEVAADAHEDASLAVPLCLVVVRDGRLWRSLAVLWRQARLHHQVVEHDETVHAGTV